MERGPLVYKLWTNFVVHDVSSPSEPPSRTFMLNSVGGSCCVQQGNEGSRCQKGGLTNN